MEIWIFVIVVIMCDQFGDCIMYLSYLF